MIAEKKDYNTGLLKGTGLIQETFLLLDLYRQGDSRSDLVEKAIASNVMAKGHDNRIKDIVNRVFYPRYISPGKENILLLKKLREFNVSIQVFNQLFLVYTCKANTILFDFVVDVYQQNVRQGKKTLPNQAALSFVEEAIKNGEIHSTWAKSTQVRIARHIIATLADFKLVDTAGNILPYYLLDDVANYLAHELHFRGLSDHAVMDAEEWALFGYHRHDVTKHLERLSFYGHYIFQSSGELTKINWLYKDMNELIYAIGHQV